MSTGEQFQIAVEPIISYPHQAQAGKSYLMTIDLRLAVPPGTWPYEDEEYPIWFLLDTMPLFSWEPLSENEQSVVLHRFGGTYGPAKFLLTATNRVMSGTLHITLLNRWGTPIASIPVDCEIQLAGIPRTTVPGLERPRKEVEQTSPSGQAFKQASQVKTSQAPMESRSKIESTMFREYDIRGRENEQELNEKSASLIGKGYGTFLIRKNIRQCVLGHDNRRTSEAMHAAIKDALMSCGVHVIDIGLVTTPMLYWAQLFFYRQEGLDTRGGVMVTASHNPIGWNGVKLADGYASTLLTEDLQRIYHLILADDFEQGSGSSETRNIFDEYCSDLVSRVFISKPLKVVINTANGTTGAFAPTVFRRADATVIEYFTELDSTYPHYTPNPADVGMMEDTGRVVRESGADIGVAIDADGDRLGITDENGGIIWPDRYLILLSRQVLERHPSAKIVFDVKASNALSEDIRAHGGVPIMWKSGHSYIKSKLREVQGALAGETSGHIFFAEGYYGFDDAIFAGLKLLEYLSNQDRPLSQVIADTPYYVSTPTYSAEVRDTDGQRADEYKYKIVDELTQYFKSQNYEVIDINGVRVAFPDGSWGLVRASSNLPTLVMRFEAKSHQRLDEVIALFRKQLDKYPGVSKEWVTA